MNFLTEKLNSAHDRKSFSCGKEMLDDYFRKQANQDVKKKLSACFILSDEEKKYVKGYYTLSGGSVPADFIPEGLSKKFPKSYRTIPTTLLGRLAIDSRFHGQGLGQDLLIDALKRSYYASTDIGSFAVIVDPLDADAEKFYRKYGFIKLPDSGKMFLPMNTISKLFEE